MLEIDRRRLKIALQDEVVIIEHFTQLGREALAMKQIGDAQCAARDLVLIRRPNAASGRADRILALRLFTRLVERNVRGKNQRTGGAHAQALEYRNALSDQHFRFLEKRLERQHHPIADETTHMRVQDSGRDQRQNGFLSADDQRMTGVVAALEAHHRVRLVGEQIDDLALAFVAPLQADHDQIFTHCAPSTAMPVPPPC